ncbi:MAG: hypothetical protein NTW11_04235 [Candidatus Staskawiczbacteria bacterium]|nr:hypothetical protein [Candidatus Staskawiczbacteria bacterium]
MIREIGENEPEELLPEKEQTKEQILAVLERAQDQKANVRITLAELDADDIDDAIMVTIKGFYGDYVVTQLKNGETRDIALEDIEEAEIIEE